MRYRPLLLLLAPALLAGCGGGSSSMSDPEVESPPVVEPPPEPPFPPALAKYVEDVRVGIGFAIAAAELLQGQHNSLTMMIQQLDQSAASFRNIPGPHNVACWGGSYELTNWTSTPIGVPPVPPDPDERDEIEQIDIGAATCQWIYGLTASVDSLSIRRNVDFTTGPAEGYAVAATTARLSSHPRFHLTGGWDFSSAGGQLDFSYPAADASMRETLDLVYTDAAGNPDMRLSEKNGGALEFSVQLPINGLDGVEFDFTNLGITKHNLDGGDWSGHYDIRSTDPLTIDTTTEGVRLQAGGVTIKTPAGAVLTVATAADPAYVTFEVDLDGDGTPDPVFDEEGEEVFSGSLDILQEELIRKLL